MFWRRPQRGDAGTRLDYVYRQRMHCHSVDDPTRAWAAEQYSVPNQPVQAEIASERMNGTALRYCTFLCDSVNDLFCFVE